MSSQVTRSPHRPNWRVSAAFYMSIADIFTGAAGVLIILIVLSTQADEPRIQETYDFTATCSQTAEGLVITPTDHASLPVTTWLSVQPHDVLMSRWLVRPEGADIQCFLDLRAAVQTYNAQLEIRGAKGAVVALGYWYTGTPEAAEGDRDAN